MGESTLVHAGYVLLFVNHLQWQGNTIWADDWTGTVTQVMPRQVFELRERLDQGFKDALDSRDLSTFPIDLVADLSRFLRRPVGSEGIGPQCVSGAKKPSLSAMQSKVTWNSDERTEE
eukprot:NODE_2595_length_461_cov_702.502427_g2149_i0.p1 GENE.NODE_2595_length_461_cov_702.502427_g2149_i0~~NODE_2595_length_461_cov_702.502427_g2149_i0.p1  ORF type:complete len:128 (+),score=27.27 NODE_2595_length_461_cov_702.502427_g2149_i0:32-385(+)